MLIGNLGRDPEMSYTPSGKAVTKFTVAVSRRWTDRESNERREETTWFNVVAWDRLAETCTQYLHKGSKVYLEGRMTSRKYTNKDGVEMTAWDVNLTDMQMLDPRSAEGGQGQGQRIAEAGYTDPDEIPF
jgi:single-strand DNA-binding protein